MSVVSFLPGLALWRHKWRHYHRNTTTFVLKLAKLACYFLIFNIRPNLRSNFCYCNRRLESFKMILRKSIVFGSRGGATEILTMISVQKCHFLAISENWSNEYACCSFNSIIYNNFSVYIHSLDFPLIIYVTKIGQFLISNRANFNVRGPCSLNFLFF